MGKQQDILTVAITDKYSYNKYQKENKKLKIKGIRKQNYYRLKKEFNQKKLSIKELKSIEKYKPVREKIHKKEEKQYENYSVEIKGNCSVYKRFPGGRKKFVRNELVTGGCQLNYQDAKDEFKSRFTERRDAIWQSKHEELILDGAYKNGY